MTFAVALIWMDFGCKDKLGSEKWDGVTGRLNAWVVFITRILCRIPVLNDCDRRTVAYIRHHVTGLPFYPGPKERSLGVHSQDRVKEDIVAIWQKCQTSQAFAVAYKAGHVEKDLLEQLRLPSINLETWGCPKYELCTPPPFDCGCHFNSRFHCSMSECYAFMTWFNTDNKLNSIKHV